MSTNKTTNYQLHAWEPSDDFLLSEINENFAALDASARVVTGSYTGDGEYSQVISLGFTPRAVLVAPLNGQFTESGSIYGGMGVDVAAATARTASAIRVAVVEGGFRVWYYGSVHLNDSGQTRCFVALR